MAASRMSTVWGLLAARAVGRGGPATAADVCAVCVATVAVSGAAVTVMGETGAGHAGTGHVICVTDEASEQLEDLQLTFGEGPRVDALAAGAPVLVPDLDASEIAGRWPVFGPGARLAGAAAVFAFPLQIGAIRVGVMDLYRRLPGQLSARQLGDSLMLADAATVFLLDRQDRDGRAGTLDGDGRASADGFPDGDGMAGPGPGGQPLDLGLHRAEIDQATGMLTEQLGVSIDEAFVRLRAYAYAHDRRLADVARDLVSRALRLGPGSPPPGGAA
jgi:ANTAR domain